ncbi:MAG: O-antigen ligase family protein, partial [Planctomycetes bacterium]|nr:O-antigen ligase family protein [Planctomycetota bacterium]
KTGDTFGPYVVSNHFAGCMELTIPLVVGLLLAWPVRSRRGRWIAIGLAVLLSVGVLTVVGWPARSRAGVASLMAGLLVVAWLTARKPIARRAWGIALGLYLLAWAALFVTLATWQADVEPKAGTSTAHEMDIRTLARDVKGRLDGWQTCGRMFLQSPWLGTGLGTFAELYPATVDTRHRLYYAHNDYLQFAVEAGLLGLAVAGSVVVWLVRRIWAGRARLMAPERRGVAAGLLGGLFAILLHGLFDWNAHLPANALLAVVILGILLAMTTQGEPTTDDTDAREPDFRHRLARAWPTRLAVVAVMAGCIAAAVVHATAQQQLMPLRRAVVHQRLSDEKLSALAKRQAIREAIPSALRGARLTPWSYRHAEELGKAYLHLSRGRPSPELNEARRWFRRATALCPVETSTPTTFDRL